MRINLLTAGTRGDVQPAIALGLGLKNAGFTVQMVAFEEFRALTGEHELDFFPLRASVQELAKSSLVGLAGSGAAVFRAVPELIKLFRELFLQMTADFWQASQDADILISNTATAMSGAAVAERLSAWADDMAPPKGWDGAHPRPGSRPAGGVRGTAALYQRRRRLVTHHPRLWKHRFQRVKADRSASAHPPPWGRSRPDIHGSGPPAGGAPQRKATSGRVLRRTPRHVAGRRGAAAEPLSRAGGDVQRGAGGLPPIRPGASGAAGASALIPAQARVNSAPRTPRTTALVAEGSGRA